VLGVATNGAEALRLVGELRPDVVLVDIDLGEDSGFDVARELARADGGGANGTPAVILISTHAEADLAELIAEAPVAGTWPSRSSRRTRSRAWPAANAPRGT
jgi:CheY-like chemotaxis protein